MISDYDMKAIRSTFAEIGRLATMSPEMLAGLALARAVAYAVREGAYDLEDGCVANLSYESHSRGKNWVATVTPNRAAPGGLDREFWKHGSDKWYAAPSTLKAGDIIEMGGDYVSGRGNKTRDRRYVLVVRVEEGHIVGAFLGKDPPSTKRATAERKAHGLAA